MVEILLERSTGVATVTLDRSERRNAMSDALLEELIAAVREIDFPGGSR
jgi:enoyl-CoA hydratase/carnithine racemase